MRSSNIGDEEYLKSLVLHQNSLIKRVCLSNWSAFENECETEKLFAVKSCGKVDMTVQAIAGNGKTYFIFGGTMQMVAFDDINLSDIIYLSFTNSAKNESFNRLEKKFGYFASCLINAYTIHSFALGLVNLERKNKKKPLAPFSEKEISDIVDEMGKIEHERILDLYFRKFIEKDTLTNVEDQILKKYTKLKKEKQKILNESFTDTEVFKFVSFDEILLKAIFLIKKTGCKFRKFKHIFVDEGQDVNRFQQSFLLHLKDYYSCKMTIVGDEGQDIFGKLQKEKGFLCLLKNSELHFFVNNRRCSKGIVNAFKAVLQHSIKLEMKGAKNEHYLKILENRLNCITFSEVSENEDNDVSVYSCIGWKEEKEKIVEIIQMNCDKRIRVLCRVKSCLSDLSKYLVEKDIDHDYLSSSMVEESKNVVLETIDNSKGKEADVGIICSFNQFILPFEFKSNCKNSSNMTIEGIILESRRLYLALARFREKVHLTYSIIVTDVPAFGAVKKHVTKSGVSMFFDLIKPFCNFVDYSQQKDIFIELVNRLSAVTIEHFDVQKNSIRGKLQKLHEESNSKYVENISRVVVKSGTCDICHLGDPEELLIRCLYCKKVWCLEKGK